MLYDNLKVIEKLYRDKIQRQNTAMQFISYDKLKPRNHNALIEKSMNNITLVVAITSDNHIFNILKSKPSGHL